MQKLSQKPGFCRRRGDKETGFLSKNFAADAKTIPETRFLPAARG
jgi:hypothetical protein